MNSKAVDFMLPALWFYDSANCLVTCFLAMLSIKVSCDTDELKKS